MKKNYLTEGKNFANEKLDLKWKAVISEVFRQLNIIGNRFSGSITVNMNQGGVRNIERKEIIE